MNKTTKNKKSGSGNRVIFILSVVIMAGVISMGFFPVSHSGFARGIRTMLKHAAIDSCSVERVSLTFFNGIVIKELNIWEKIGSGKTIRLSFPELRVDYRVFRIIPRWKEYKASLKNRITALAYVLKKQRKGAVAARNESALLPLLYSDVLEPAMPILSSVETAVLTNGVISVDSLGTKVFYLAGLDGTVRCDKAEPSHFTLQVSVDTCISGQLKTSRLSTKALVEGPRCTFSSIQGVVSGGDMQSSFDLDLQKNMINSGTVSIKSLQFKKIYTARRKQSGHFTGTVDCSLEFDTCVVDPDSLKCSGVFTMRDVSMNKLPPLKKFVRLTGLTSLFHLNFRMLTGDFRLDRGKITSDSLIGEGRPVSVKGSGWLNRHNGKYSFKVKGMFEPEYKDSVSQFVWNSLVPEKKGKRSFFCSVYGNDRTLNVSLEKRVMRRAVNNIIKDFNAEMEGVFKR